MRAAVPPEVADLWSTDRDRQNVAYERVLGAATQPVPWAADVWDDVVAHLTSRDNHDRAIAGQLLSHLAVSDPERAIRDLPALLAVTWDQRFVTARHVLLSLWRVGLAGEGARAALLDALARRYRDAETERNGHLVRTDLFEVLGRVAAATGDPAVDDLVAALLATEADAKVRSKGAAAWRKAKAGRA